MPSNSEFLFDDEGMVVEQRYRIGQAIESEAQRRASYYPGDPNNTASMKVAAASATAAFNSTSGADRSGAGSVMVRQLTKLEQRRMDTIGDRQRQNLVQKQVVGGKEYKGIGFLPEPRVVEFTDFDVGQVYKVKVQITNVSQTFNAFKVLQMPANVRDLFDVVWTPQSMMSAGMCCTIVVVFSPKEDVDIDAIVPLLAQTGPINIPVKCRRKRVVASLSTNLIDFGAIVVAEEVEETLLIRNDGALSTKMEIGGEFLSLLAITQRNAKGQSVPTWETVPELHRDKTNRMTLQPFSTTSLTIRFKPMEVASFDSSIFISFDNHEVEDKVVFIRAASVDVPVFVDYNQVMDFKCCYYDTLYRDKVVVRNTTKSAVRVQPTVPTALKDVVEFVPKFGFVQPDGARFEFQVKFMPVASIGAEVDTQMKIVVTDQVMPIFFRLKAALSRRELVVDPPSLQYGMCVLQEALKQKLTITNVSRLPRTLGFTKIPPNISISPANILTLAPNETCDFDVAVQPVHAGPFSQQLTLRTEHDDTVYIPVSGHGKVSAFALEPSIARLPKVCIGGSVSVTSVLTNTTNELQKFSFRVNANYGITISPASGELQRKSSVPIVVTFNPTQASVDPIVPPEVDEAEDGALNGAGPDAPANRPPSKGGKKKTKAEEEAERKEKERLEEERRARIAAAKAERARILAEIEKMEPWEKNAEGEPWSRHRTMLIPCFIEGWSCMALFLQVRCTVVEPVVVPMLQRQGPSTSRPPSGQTTNRSARSPSSVALPAAAQSRVAPSAVPPALSVSRSAAVTVDFGDVPAQHAVTRTITLINHGELPTRVAVRPLDPFGAFTIVRPPASPLNPGNETEVIVQFMPKAKAVYVQKIVIDAVGANDVIIDCVGEGLPALLAIATKKEDAGDSSLQQAELRVEMGPCLVNDKVETSLYFANLSPFPLEIKTHFDAASITNFNPNATIPFSLHPHTFTIPASGRVEVVATFQPGAESAFDAAAAIEFGGEGSVKTVRFTGSGWSRGLYVQFPSEVEQMTSDARRRDVWGMVGDAMEAAGTTAQNPLVLHFASKEQNAVSSAIVIGNNKGSTVGDFTIEGLSDMDVKNGWKIDVLKANVAPASKSTVTVSFTPTQLLLDSLPLQGIGVVAVANIRLILKGGSPSTDQTYFVRLKGSAWR